MIHSPEELIFTTMKTSNSHFFELYKTQQKLISTDLIKHRLKRIVLEHTNKLFRKGKDVTYHRKTSGAFAPAKWLRISVSILIPIKIIKDQKLVKNNGKIFYDRQEENKTNKLG